jgi:hypothetical protein
MKNGKYKRMLQQAAKRRAAIKAVAARLGNKQAALQYQISEARVSQIVNGK